MKLTAVQRDRACGALLATAAGDALGAGYEFNLPMPADAAVDMIGGGLGSFERGEWTDDTSMALCLASSLTELGRFDPADQMKRYWKWVEEGYLSSNGRCFDVSKSHGQ